MNTKVFWVATSFRFDEQTINNKHKYIYIYIYIYIHTVFHRSEHTPHIFVNMLLYKISCDNTKEITLATM